MTAVSYTPGTWLAIVRSRMAVLLEPDTQPVLVAALWDLLEGHAEVHAVLHAVTSSSGGSLANMPSFGILDFSGPLRVFLRGDLEMTVQSPDAAAELSGRDVTTWTERRFALPGLCRLDIPAAAGTASHQGVPELPLGEGVVLLQSLVLTPGTDPAHPGPEPSDATSNATATVVTTTAAALVVEEAGDDVSADLPGITVAPDHGASAETVYAVIDDDYEVDPAADANPQEKLDRPPEDGPEADKQPVAGGDDALGGAPGAAGALVSGADGPSSGPEQVPASELTSSYDHLWERTVVRRIEDAAVRENPEAAGPEAAGPEAAGPEAGSEEAIKQEPTGLEVEDQPEEAAAPVRPPAGSLIDSVPWRTTGTRREPASPPAVLSPMLSAVPPASSVAPVAPGPEAAHADYDGDHDGQTVVKSSLAGLASRPAPATTDVSASGPLVLARLCPGEHANPPTSSVCAACGAGLLPDTVQVARPRLGRMRISTGELVNLDESLVIGRQPSVSRVQSGGMPRLVQVASPGGDISRSHVEVRLEGWHVMLCDLKATNGTVLVREGQAPRRLAQNEMAILLDGDIAELGDNISLRFEEIP